MYGLLMMLADIVRELEYFGCDSGFLTSNEQHGHSSGETRNLVSGRLGPACGWRRLPLPSFPRRCIDRARPSRTLHGICLGTFPDRTPARSLPQDGGRYGKGPRPFRYRRLIRPVETLYNPF